MSTTKTDASITRVTYRWDDQAGVEPGWYAETYDADGFCDDSQKIWFLVSVDNYHRYEGAQLRGALRRAFPNAEIEAL